MLLAGWRVSGVSLDLLLLLEAVSPHVASGQALARRAGRRGSWERALLIIHLAGYLTAVFLVLSSTVGPFPREPPKNPAQRQSLCPGALIRVGSYGSGHSQLCLARGAATDRSKLTAAAAAAVADTPQR